MKVYPSTKTEKILALLKDGVSPVDVAKKVKVSTAYVYTLRSKHGKKKPGRPKKEKVVEQKWVEVTYPGEALIPNPLLLPDDPVNHPPHYTAGGIETLDFIEAKDLNYRLGNVIKYVSRAGKKADGDPIQDLEKAAFYLNREIIIRKGA